ncbi:hypothetical protein C8Q80DRAFT_1273798 [Daedaleopsis nitida]|nr:hypothetical protein C8Q80DRAFT_1273798 [Daedaleopsis nitida]
MTRRRVHQVPLSPAGIPAAGATGVAWTRTGQAVDAPTFDNASPHLRCPAANVPSEIHVFSAHEGSSPVQQGARATDIDEPAHASLRLEPRAFHVSPPAAFLGSITHSNVHARSRPKLVRRHERGSVHPIYLLTCLFAHAGCYAVAPRQHVAGT